MTDRSPATDGVDAHLVDGLISNMRDRHHGDLDPESLRLDFQRLYDEIAFARLRRGYLLEQCERAAAPRESGAFVALLGEHDRQIERLDNARKFLKAEKMQREGFPLDQIALLIDKPDF